MNPEYTPSPEFISKLTKDVWVFSAFKEYDLLRTATNLLYDTNGKLQPYYKFRDAVLDLHATYNRQYLKSEYQHAVGSSLMASKWKQYEQDGDRYYLQYRTARDERVRLSHQTLDKVVQPIDSPFWDNFYPPNGWRCRCNVVQVLKSKYKPSDLTESLAAGEESLTVRNADKSINQKATERNQMFKFNPGKQAAIFPNNHPYYKVQQREFDNIKNFANLQYLDKIRQEYKTMYGTDWSDKFTLAESFDIPENLNLTDKISYIAKQIVNLQNEVAFVLEDNGRLIARLTGVKQDVDSNKLNLNFTNLTIIHNHPTARNLSLLDIKFTLINKVKKMIATINSTNQMRYIEMPIGGWNSFQEFVSKIDNWVDNDIKFNYETELFNFFNLQIKTTDI